MRVHSLFTGIACILLAIWISSCATSKLELRRALDIEGTTELLSTWDLASPTSTDPPVATIPPANSMKIFPTVTPQPTNAILELVREDLARRLNAVTAEIEVIHLESRTWPDASLGCVARKGVFNEQSIPGYRILLSYLGLNYEYHTSLAGEFRYCRDAEKPLDPIQ